MADKYRLLDLRRRRAQIEARHALERAGLCDSTELEIEFTNDNPGRTADVALVPPDTVANPPAVFPLVVEQDAATGAHVVFEFGHRGPKQELTLR
jgi:hypothetical protein